MWLALRFDVGEGSEKSLPSLLCVGFDVGGGKKKTRASLAGVKLANVLHDSGSTVAGVLADGAGEETGEGAVFVLREDMDSQSSDVETPITQSDFSGAEAAGYGSRIPTEGLSSFLRSGQWRSLVFSQSGSLAQLTLADSRRRSVLAVRAGGAEE